MSLTHFSRNTPPDSPPYRDVGADSSSDDDETKAFRSQSIGRFNENRDDPWTTYQAGTHGLDVTPQDS